VTHYPILNWIGSNARWVLAIGSVLALFLPSLSAFLRPALPFLVSTVLAMALARMDMFGLLRAIIQPKRLAFLVSISVVLMPVTAATYLGLARLFGLDAGNTASLIYLAAVPPIASAAGLCFLLRFNAVLAVQLTLVATLLTPVLGVATINLLLENPPLIEPLALSLRLSWIIALGFGLSFLIRYITGAARIERNAKIFDGMSALNMLVFVVPLFDGVLAIINTNSMRALLVLGLAIIFNFGVNLATTFAAGKITSAKDAGAYGVINGNHTIAIYLAVIPADPAFMLFVALYQFPMYLTPVFGSVFSAAAGKRQH